MPYTALSKANKKVKLFVLAGSVALVGLLILVMVSMSTKRPASTPTAHQIAQNECADMAFSNYIKAKFALSQQQGATPLPSVEQTIAGRRLQEQFCLQFSRCLLSGANDQLFAVQYAASFGSCLRDEVLEGYDAVSRTNDGG